MAKLSLLLNRINPIQKKSKDLPINIFDGIKSAKVDYDFLIQIPWIAIKMRKILKYHINLKI